jgi:hypothetical protein
LEKQNTVATLIAIAKPAAAKGVPELRNAT